MGEYSPKSVGPLDGTILPWVSVRNSWDQILRKAAHIRAALEEDWFMAGTFTVCKCAHSLAGLILVRGEHIVEAYKTDSGEEPFTVVV